MTLEKKFAVSFGMNFRPNLESNHWRIREAPPARAPLPNRINFFRFRIRFHRKVYASEVGAPPTGNPGSATGNRPISGKKTEKGSLG